MVKIYFKIFLLSLPALILVFLVGNFYSKGFVDYYYNKITNDGNSIIIGTSRSSQGIRPQELMKNLKYNGPMLNFAMSSFDSPYSQNYFKAIRSKIGSDVKNGLYIVEVEPLGVYHNQHEHSKSEKLNFVLPLNSKPNYEYLYRNVNPYYKLVLHNNETFPTTIQHDDGWLEVRLKLDSTQRKSSSDTKYSSSSSELRKLSFSAERWEYLSNIIDYLKQHGRVFILRMPAEKRFIELEQNILPEFNSKIERLAHEKNVKYFNLTNLCEEFQYIDGNHFDLSSSLKFSKLLNQLIQQESERTY
jgi:hypothetical protein